MTLATFGGGCFWGIEEMFRTTTGVLNTASGYMGGKTTNPSYRDVCSGTTDHAEVVHLTFDDKIITYTDLLALFFENHNPTQLNHQGPDVGSQYRSVIFTHSDTQHNQSLEYIKELAPKMRLNRSIVTQVIPATDFWIAEDYHQQYLKKRGLSTCHI